MPQNVGVARFILILCWEACLLLGCSSLGKIDHCFPSGNAPKHGGGQIYLDFVLGSVSAPWL